LLIKSLQIYTLYRACVIYSHTSMYPGQMAYLTSDGDAADDVFTSAMEIIELSRQVVADERWDLQFIPFSLFLSGVVSRKKEDKALALKLMTALERESYGENTATMRRLLETIYDKQQATSRNGTPNLEIDWLEVMERSGPRLVMFGM
jgi:Fungal specific transcription factor domain